VADRPAVVLDGCHNPGAALALAAALDADPPARPLVLVHGSRPEKDWRGVLATLLPRCDALVETATASLEAPDILAAGARALAPGLPVEAIPDLATAVARARALAGERGTVLIAGSLYLVGAAVASRPWDASPSGGSAPTLAP
jgi:dihydrofolate synthase/folylpolyglutamate synthase